MGLISDVLLRFRADTKQARKEISKLQGKQKDLAKSALASSEKTNAALDKQIKMWGKVAIGVGVVVGAYKTLTAGAEAYAKRSRLLVATAGADFKALQAAAGGLISETEALQFAAQQMNGAFSTSNKEMQDAAKFARILANRQGLELKPVIEEVGKAILEGEVEPLKKFGVIIRDVQPGMEAHNALLKEINRTIDQTTDSQERSGDAIQRAQIKWKDALDRLVRALGQIAVALAPIVEAVAFIVNKLLDLPDLVAPVTGGTAGDVNAAKKLLASGVLGAKQEALVRAYIAQEEALLRQNKAGRAALKGPDINARIAAGGGPVTSGRGGGTPFRLRAGAFERGEAIDFGRFGAPGLGDLGPGALGGGLSRGLGQTLEEAKQFDVGGFGAQIEANRMLAQSFAQLQNIGVQAFATLAAGAGEMFASMLDGTKLAAGGFREMMGGILHSMSAQMFGMAITEGVMALAALAKGIGGNPKGFAEAAVHGKAAAAAAGAGAAVAGMSRAFGGGGGGGGGGLPAAATGAVGGGSVGGGSTSTTIFITDLSDDPRSIRKRIADTVERSQTDNPRGRALEHR